VTSYLLRRLFSVVPVLWAVATLIWIILFALPGDPAVMLSGGLRSDPRVLERVRAEWGLNDSAGAQYLRYLTRLARGDLGSSYLQSRPVSRILAETLLNENATSHLINSTRSGTPRRKRWTVKLMPWKISRIGPKSEKGPGADTKDPNEGPTGLTTTEYPHYQNFIDAIRANDPKVLTCDVLEGHLSSTLPHLGNISYQVGRQLQFDGKTEKFVNDQQADQLLTREYRKGFEVPGSFGNTSHDQANR
jgi:hypothetical protein